MSVPEFIFLCGLNEIDDLENNMHLKNTYIYIYSAYTYIYIYIYTYIKMNIQIEPAVLATSDAGT